MADPFSGSRCWLLPPFTLLMALLMLPVARAQTAEAPSPSAGDVVHLEADQQRREGQVFFADGNVDVRYQEMRLRADHVQYSAVTYEIIARGHVVFDQNTEHMEAESAQLNAKTGQGQFEKVFGELRIQRQPNQSILITPNPLSFTADHVDRVNLQTYRIFRARVTVCDPQRPKWTFDSSEATLHVDHTVALLNANFRLFRIPLVYLPYASLPAGRRVRQSGFLLPEVGKSSLRGYTVGDSYYWAPADWADATVGAEWLSLRGSSENGEVRMRPWEGASVSGNYFGVVDKRGQGGHKFSVKFDTLLGHGWRASGDVNELSSFVFQEVFSPSFSDAVNSEVNSSGFLTDHFSGFSLNFAANSYKDFLTAQPQTAISLRSAPEVRFDSVDQAPWKRAPIYFGLDAYTDAVYRSDTEISTKQFVDRGEFAPRVTLPLHWGPWLGVTPTYSFQIIRYGASEFGGTVVNIPVRNTTGEVSVDLRPPSFERVWQGTNSKWKHTIEPEIVYRYVTGVNDFARFIRIDENDTLTDTNEIEYSVTQRLFRRKSSGSSEELVSWTLLQKYYFDPTFGGALIPGVRNVFQALDSVTPFAFADGLRRFSPLVSDIRITPGGRYDAEFRTDYDPLRGRITSSESLLKMHPYGDLNLTLAHYDISANSALQPFSNQVRAIVGYRDATRQGWNVSMGFSYDFRQGVAQNELAQVGYNGSCCGISFGFQRFSLGAVRNENQFRLSLIIANLGAFGNARRQDKVF